MYYEPFEKSVVLLIHCFRFKYVLMRNCGLIAGVHMMSKEFSLCALTHSGCFILCLLCVCYGMGYWIYDILVLKSNMIIM